MLKLTFTIYALSLLKASFVAKAAIFEMVHGLWKLVVLFITALQFIVPFFVGSGFPCCLYLSLYCVNYPMHISSRHTFFFFF